MGEDGFQDANWPQGLLLASSNSKRVLKVPGAQYRFRHLHCPGFSFQSPLRDNLRVNGAL